MKFGKRESTTDAPGHVKGVRQGNAVGNYENQPGHLPDGRSSAERSTGINPSAREPIDPRMPNLSPA